MKAGRGRACGVARLATVRGLSCWVMRWLHLSIVLLLPAMAFCGAARAASPTLVLKFPEKLTPKSAVATSWEMKLTTPGKIDSAAHTITFEKLLPDTPYEVALTMADGMILQGVNLDWYGMDPPKPNVQPMSEEDQKAVTDMVTSVMAFENKKRVMMVRGNSDRITTLVELIRDVDFHAAGGNIIWRVELWYFKNQFGGWQQVKQQNRVLRRERFKDQAAYDAVVPKVKWIPELGGFKIPKDKQMLEITLPADLGAASAAAAEMKETPKAK